MKNNKPELEDDYHHQHDLERLKAVAQAWHAHSGSPRTATEFGACRIRFKANPTRFKLEAMNKPPAKDIRSHAHWDFRESLWDSYEIVTVSKRLEAGLVSDQQFPVWDGERPWRKESKNSLRNLINQKSSRRFHEDDIPDEDEEV